VPVYTLVNKKTGERVERSMSISEGDDFERRNPDWERACGAPGIGDSFRLGLGAKPSDAFRDRLREIKRVHRKSTIDVK
jgi:hypothetical protein